MLNKQLLIGNVGADPEFGTLQDGNTWARFRIATTERSYTTSRGQQVPERTTWHNIECWGGLARVIAQNVHKGDKLYIEGIHHTREYEDKEHRRQTWYYTDANYVEFLGTKPPQTAEPAQTEPQPAPAATQAEQPATPQTTPKNDLPF